VLGVLVFVHELGHFLAAKQVGIRVLKFQLGFNPTVLSFKRGDTEYGIGALPLGGYVKMAGDSPEDVPTGRTDEFLAKSKWQRFLVLVMGPTMNILLALVLLTVVLYHGVDTPAFEDQPVIVGALIPSSPATRADVRPGDRIISVGGHDVDTWERFFLNIGSRPNQDVSLRLVRNGTVLTRTVRTTVDKTQSHFEVGDIGVLPNVHPRVRTVQAGGAAEAAGMRPNDMVVAVDGETIIFASHLKETIAKHPDQPITLTIQRDGQTLTLRATPSRVGAEGLLGIGINDEVRTIKPGLKDAIKLSLARNLEFAKLIFQTVWGLITRETSPRQLMGPVAIAQMSGESVQLGWVALLSLMASLSLNLGILNLLPIPVLDGGHIFIMLLEASRSRRRC
jgi:regulator of sigma E protease